MLLASVVLVLAVASPPTGVHAVLIAHYSDAQVLFAAPFTPPLDPATRWCPEMCAAAVVVWPCMGIEECSRPVVRGGVRHAVRYSPTRLIALQCPCSARVPQDMKETFLDNPDYEGLVDFEQ